MNFNIPARKKIIINIAKEHQSRLSCEMVTFKIAMIIKIQEKMLKKEDSNVLYQVCFDLLARTFKP